MSATYLNLAKEHGVSYGDVMRERTLAEKEARPYRLKKGTPAFFQFVFKRLKERVKALGAERKAEAQKRLDVEKDEAKLEQDQTSLRTDQGVLKSAVVHGTSDDSRVDFHHPEP